MSKLRHRSHRTNGSSARILVAFLAALYVFTAWGWSGSLTENGKISGDARSTATEKYVAESKQVVPTRTPPTPAKDLQNYGNWTEAEIVTYMKQHPQRSYFSHLFAYGGFRKGIEIGVQDGRFSELFLQQTSKLLPENWSLVLVEPEPTPFLEQRLGLGGHASKWKKKSYLKKCQVTLQRTMSTDPALLAIYPDGYFDFVYLDASHEYEAVKAELPLWWPKVRSGGILAGHDYCNYGESGQSCNGCKNVPQCGPYTRWGSESAMSKKGRSANQNGVVMAVQDWLVALPQSLSLTLRHTLEDFTRESLAKDGFHWELVVRRDQNPSWYIYKA